MADDNNTSTKRTSNTTRRRRSVKDIPADQISTPVSEEMEQPSREVEPSAEEIASSSEEREYLSMLQHKHLSRLFHGYPKH